MASLDQSLKRMSLDYVDIFYSHRPDPETPIEETLSALTQAVHQGKALYVGVSSYNAEQTRRATFLLREAGTPCLIHQPNYSLFNRWIEKDLLNVLGEDGVGCIAFCPLAQGLLTNRYLAGIPEGSRAAKPHGFLKPAQLTPARLDQVRRLNDLALARGQTLAQMALTWVLRDQRVTSALIGASRVEQIEENVKALTAPRLSDTELAAIEIILK
jgi:L-glyceraldehyde 3-phosphate reductase